jgi:hypothetical protein
MLRGTGVKARGPHLQINLSPLQREHFALHAPAIRVGYGHSNLVVGLKMTANGSISLTLEESLPWGTFFQFAKDRKPKELIVLMREPQHLTQRRHLAVNGGI